MLECLDSDGLGLPFRWLVAAFADTNAVVGEAVIARLAHAAGEMVEQQNDPDWHLLKA